MVLAYIRCLREEAAIVDALYDLALEKRQVIISGKVSRLEEMTRQEERLAKELELLEGRRQGLNSDLALSFPGIPPSITGKELAALLEKRGEKLAFELKEEVRLLGGRLARLKEENAFNLELLEQSLTYLEALKGIITGDKDTLYSPKGLARAEISSFTLVDRKV